MSKFMKLINEVGVDKTLFLNELFEDENQNILFIRPEGYGKATLMSMIIEFCTQDDYSVFNDFAIRQTKMFDKHCTQHPVINMDFSTCVLGNTKEDIIRDLKQVVLEVAHTITARYFYGNPSSNHTLQNLIAFLKDSQDLNLSQLKHALLDLCKLNYVVCGDAQIIILENYDVPIINAYTTGHYEELKEFFSVFFGSILKESHLYHKCILTGIHAILMENTMYGKLPLYVNHLYSDSYTGYFGFTQEEISQLSRKKHKDIGFISSTLMNTIGVVEMTCVLNKYQQKNYYLEQNDTYLINVITKLIQQDKEQLAPLCEQFNWGVKMDFDYYYDLWSNLDSRTTLLKYLLDIGFVCIKDGDIVFANIKGDTVIQHILKIIS